MNTLYLKSFIRCRRKAWLDFKGDKSYEVWPAHKAIDKVKQYQIFSKLCNGEIYTGLKACENGYQGVIGLKNQRESIPKYKRRDPSTITFKD